MGTNRDEGVASVAMKKPLEQESADPSTILAQFLHSRQEKDEHLLAVDSIISQ